MKKLLIFICLLAAMTATAQTNVKVDSKGNYYATKTTERPKDSGTVTGKTFTDINGTVYPVVRSKNNKLFYVRTSKTGNVYRVYIKL